MDISALTILQLKDLLNQIPAEIKRREKTEKANLLKDLEQLAAERGFSLSDVIGDGVEKKAKGTVAVKYRSASNASQTWTGRGRQPKWVQEHIANGGKIEDFAI
jgi:DNA-binding protein H-NS